MSDRFDNYVKGRVEDRAHVGRRAKLFDLYDNKARIIGYQCHIYVEVWIADEASHALCNREYIDRPIWKVHPHATRDGKSYGASLDAKIVFSEAEAFAVADKMIEAYHRKMAKQFGKVVA